ncbi:hypothetical protein G6F68_012360 [Rhizopus microsporus]|nr:hypothetical protein G6F68_012360 [Rhizopus microsporus]
MVIPIWTSLQKLDPTVEHAALSLNASRFQTLTRIVLPQAMPGILSGSLIVFGLSASSFAIPALLGGRRLKMVATVVYDEFLTELNWPLGAAIAIVLLVVNVIIMMAARQHGKHRHAEERSYRAGVQFPGGGFRAGAAGHRVPRGVHAGHDAHGADHELFTALVPRRVRPPQFHAGLPEQPVAGVPVGHHRGVPGGARGDCHHALPLSRARRAERPVPVAADDPASGAGRGFAALFRADGHGRQLPVAGGRARRGHHAVRHAARDRRAGRL